MSHAPVLVSLTFDDSVDSHLDLAAPLLEQLGVRGTFFVYLGSHSFTHRNRQWRRLALRGHELGNHTIFHPARARCRSWVTPGMALENYSLDRMRLELKIANCLLHALDGKTERTFAYPCFETVLGRPGLLRRLLARFGCKEGGVIRWLARHPALDMLSTEQSYSSLVPELFVAARNGSLPPAGVSLPALDRFQVPCLSADGVSFDWLRRSFEAAVARNPWVVLMFHTIGRHHAPCIEPEIFQRFVTGLVADKRISRLLKIG